MKFHRRKIRWNSKFNEKRKPNLFS